MQPGATLHSFTDRVAAYAAEFIQAETNGDNVPDRAFPHLANILSATTRPDRLQSLDTLFEYLATGHALHAAAAAVAKAGKRKRAADLHELGQICLHHAAEDLAAVAMVSVYEMHAGEWMQ